MFSTEDDKALEALMNESLEKRELIEKLLASHQFTLSKISHEIRNPLTLIYSTVQLIQSQHPEVRTFKHWPELLEDVEFMVQLLEELSTYNNGERLKLTTFDFTLFMKHLVISFAASVVDTDIEFTSSISPTLPVITGDRTKLKEVFLNLLRNAQDAVDERGSIVLNAYCENGEIIVTITDTGCGISPEQLDSIFTPFITYKQNGTGLGLAIAERTVRAHHGTIQVSSVCGAGTTFTIRIPSEQKPQSD